MTDEGMDEGGGVLSGDEWEQAQYLPGESVALLTGPGPKKKPQAPAPAAPLSRILTGDEWEKAQRLPGPAIKALQLPALPAIPKPAADGAANPLTPQGKGKKLAPFDIADPTTYANPVLRQIVNPALDNPLQTALTVPALMVPGVGHALGAVMAGSMVHNIASYGWQKAAESQLSPEDRARAEADPERISGEAAAMQAAMLGLAPLIHVGAKAFRSPSYGAGMMEAGASGVHETLADPAVAPNRTADFPGELNAQFASALDEGAATARIPTESAHPAGFTPTTTGATLRTTPRAVEGLVAPDPVKAGKVTPLATDPASAPLEERAALDQSVRDYTARTAEQDHATLSAARQKDAERIAKADAMRPRRRAAKAPMFQTEQGAEVLGMAAARHGLADSASPYHPTSPETAALDAAWKEGHDAASQTGADMLKAMQESGFATMPPDATTVDLPTEGAGRGGSTVNAVAAAKRMVGEDGLRRLASAELARRGGPKTPEAIMAATEQVARTIASHGPTPDYPDGFSMGGALTDNRIPGAVELPKTATGADVPDGATPETAALAAALKPSRFRAHTTDELAAAALDAQHDIEQAQLNLQMDGEASMRPNESTGESVSDQTPEYQNHGKTLERAKARLTQIEREFALRGVSGDALAEVIQGAKEQRAERMGMQSDESLATHTGADDPFADPPAASRGLTPVDGTGELRTRGVSASIARSAIEHTAATTLGDLPEYRRLNFKDQAAQAADFLTADPAMARRVALGEVDPPHGILPEIIAIAVEQKAKMEGDVATLTDLANGKLSEQATIMGQRNAAWAMRDPESPVGAIQRVESAQEKAAKSPELLAGKALTQLKNVLRKNLIPPDDLAALINSLRC